MIECGLRSTRRPCTGGKERRPSSTWGWLDCLVSRFNLASPAIVVATKEGFEPYSHTIALDSQGRPVDPLPPMVRVRDMGAGAYPWIVLVLIVALSTAVVLLALARRGHGRGGQPCQQVRKGGP